VTLRPLGFGTDGQSAGRRATFEMSAPHY